MPELDLPEIAQHWVNVALIWLGFGTLSGLLATLILPGPKQFSPLATVVTGVAGSFLGLFCLSWLMQGKQFNPIGLMGFVAATISAFILLVIYRACWAHFTKKE